WRSLSAGLPQDVYVRAVREDPRKRGLLYAGTSIGVFFSPDAGLTWKELKLNLPAVQGPDLIVQDDDLVGGTDGRSIWIFDDLTPIRRWSAQVQAKAVHLFETIPARRYRYAGILQEGFDHGTGANPPHGATLHYYLQQKPKGEVVLEVLDDKNQL